MLCLERKKNLYTYSVECITRTFGTWGQIAYVPKISRFPGERITWQRVELGLDELETLVRAREVESGVNLGKYPCSERESDYPVRSHTEYFWL